MRKSRSTGLLRGLPSKLVDLKLSIIYLVFC
jgi:hypothetical protein